jgi:predicted deacetylase
MKAMYLLRLDDICEHMAWERFESLAGYAQELGIAPILGVIPQNEDPQLLRHQKPQARFWERMREYQDRGWEIAMHGSTHVYVNRNPGILGRGNLSEFAGLPRAQQEEKLRRGLAILKNNGLAARTFMAPSHSFDRVTLEALRSLGFLYVTDGIGFYPYKAHGLTFIPQIFSRPRRMPFGVFTFSTHLSPMEDRRFVEMLEFLKAQRASFVSLQEAVQATASLPVATAFRWMIWPVVRSYWALQRRRSADVEG